MQAFLLILKGSGMDDLSPEELQQIFKSYKAWVDKLGDKYVAGQRLENNGSLLKDKETLLTDGPFLESKEIIAGYFVIQAENQQEANEIAKTSPHLGLYEIEVRPIVMPLMN